MASIIAALASLASHLIPSHIIELQCDSPWLQWLHDIHVSGKAASWDQGGKAEKRGRETCVWPFNSSDPAFWGSEFSNPTFSQHVEEKR